MVVQKTKKKHALFPYLAYLNLSTIKPNVSTFKTM